MPETLEPNVAIETSTESGYRLSPQQKRLWPLLECGAGAFQSRCSVSVRGAVDAGLLKEAFRRTVERHEILRSAFRCPPGAIMPLQLIGEPRLAWDESVDLRGVDDVRRAVIWEAVCSRPGQLATDLAKGAQMSAVVACVRERELWLCLWLPSMCADPHSLIQIVAEISRFYNGRCVVPDSDEEPLQYADLAEWQNDLLVSEETAAARQFWQQQDFGSFERLKIPYEWTVSDGADFEPGRFEWTLEPQISVQLERCAEHLEVPVHQVLLACWHVLLWRLSDESEIVVGCFFDGRRYAELEDAMGLFARYLPLSARPDDAEDFRDVVLGLSESAEQANGAQEFFEWASNEASNFFPFCFVHREPPPTFTSGNVSFSIDRLDSVFEPFKLQLVSTATRSRQLSFDYDARCFGGKDISCIAEQFSEMLAAVVRDPATPLRELTLLGAAARRRLLVDFQPATLESPPHELLHQLFERHAEATPTAPVVVFEDRELSYGELNCRANQLGRHLRRLGAGAESVVGIFLERSPEVLVAMLGVLKVGGAYLPLDLQLPDKRITSMLKAAGSRFVIAEEARAPVLAEFQGRVVFLDAESELRVHEATPNLPARVRPENLAYVLFTSGSSGQPKGVAVEHRQLMSYLRGILPALALPDRLRYATVSTFAADLGNTAIFPALASGGCLDILSQERASDPAALVEYFRRRPVDCLKIVPSHLAALLASSDPEALLPRQLLVLGGEGSRWELIGQIAELAPERRILNHYGPTETTVGVTTHEVEEAGKPRRRTQVVSLGRPLAGTQAHVIDGGLNLVALGVPGELCIGGTNVTRGYVGRPAQTAERFVPDAFATISGQRFYRTGDRVRRLPDGSLEFLGRLDDQVKLRGFRIEPGEIAAALTSHPAIRDAVAVTREGDNGELQMIAYLAADFDNRESSRLKPDEHLVWSSSGHLIAEAENILRQQLPEFMIPQDFVLLSELPLTRNGKLDRERLPAPNSSRGNDLVEYVAPRTQIEETLASIWAEVLGVKRVGVHDEFAALGGHSLIATRLISKVRQAFRSQIPLRAIFDAPTVARLARMIEARSDSMDQSQPPPIKALPRDLALPLSFAQQRLWFLDRLEPGSVSYNITETILLQGTLSLGAFTRALREIVCRHEILRTRFEDQGGKPVQVVQTAFSLPFIIVDLNSLSGDEKEFESRRLARFFANLPFDLRHGPVLRVGILRCDRNHHVVLLSIHHIVGDHESMTILIEEFVILYEVFFEGRPSPLAPLKVQYADFAQWQRSWLKGDVLAEQLGYWRNQIGGELPVLALPTDQPRPPKLKRTGAEHPIHIDRALVADLKDLGRCERATLFMATLAAWKALLYLYSGQNDIVVGTAVTNRDRPELEGVVGFLINTLPIRTDLEGEPSFRDLVRRVRTVVLEAFAHQDLPLEKLVEELQPERDLSHSPLFRVVFSLQHAARQRLAPPGDLRVTRLGTDTVSTRFDLELLLAEVEDEVTGGLLYNTELFKSAGAARVVRDLEMLLREVCAHPDRKLIDTPLRGAQVPPASKPDTGVAGHQGELFDFESRG